MDSCPKGQHVACTARTAGVRLVQGNPPTGQCGPTAEFLLLAVRQHALRTFNALTQAVLEPAVPFALLYVSSNRQTNDLRNRLPINSRYGIELLRLFSRETNGHCSERFHTPDFPSMTCRLSSCLAW